MREPLVELGIGIIGQAIRDWRRESNIHNYKLNTANMRNIERFFKGELAMLICQQIDIDPNQLIQNLKAENRRKWLEHEKNKMEMLSYGQDNGQAGGTADEQESAVCQDCVAEEISTVRVCGENG